MPVLLAMVFAACGSREADIAGKWQTEIVMGDYQGGETIELLADGGFVMVDSLRFVEIAGGDTLLAPITLVSRGQWAVESDSLKMMFDADGTEVAVDTASVTVNGHRIAGISPEVVSAIMDNAAADFVRPEGVWLNLGVVRCERGLMRLSGVTFARGED